MSVVVFFLLNYSFFNPFFFGQEKDKFLLKKENILFAPKTKVFFSFNNYFILGKENKEKRAVFNFQPEELYLFIPFLKSYQIGLKMDEYLNQGYDIYYQSENFKKKDYFWHVSSKGGIYNLGLLFLKSFNSFLLFGEGNFNLGNNLEIFAVEKDKNILACETISYDYIGRNFKAGFIRKLEKFSFGFQLGFFKKIKEKKRLKKYSLKPDFSLFLTLYLKNNSQLNFNYFYQKDSLLFPLKNTFSFAFDFLFLNRINKINFGFSLNKIKKINFGLLSEIIIKNYGSFYPELIISYHKKENLEEFIFAFKFNILFEEFWKKRIRRWGS
ncbi:MAG: hypothetical protein N2323_04655 [candidate division WOR-3 bacterium]|nr:hypothetical protein [candidate division WOR-3 bacterium]MCX7837232.1 hypothetical protein [candidate division WOR-3 bacterium]MDW8113433.1 hypothetical protein [candidate division WOR-3 bacterium]